MITATGRIRIIKTPAGQAPEEIRRAWIGITLPCEPIVGYTEGIELGAVNHKPVPKRYSFHVPQVPAIEALEFMVPEAAKWWREHGYPRSNGWFTFGEDEAEIIFGVIRQQLVLGEEI
jgi:hypothetical protein